MVYSFHEIFSEEPVILAVFVGAVNGAVLCLTIDKVGAEKSSDDFSGKSIETTC